MGRGGEAVSEGDGDCLCAGVTERTAVKGSKAELIVHKNPYQSSGRQLQDNRNKFKECHNNSNIIIKI